MREMSKESMGKINGLQARLDKAQSLLRRWIDTMWLEAPSHSSSVNKMIIDTGEFLKKEKGDG